MPPSSSAAARVDDEAQKLSRYFDRITSCRVVIVAPHRHHRHGQRYSIHVELAVPRGRIVVSEPPDARLRFIHERSLHKHAELHAADKDLYVLIRKVFDAARRQLEDYARRLRGDVKRHFPAGGPELLEPAEAMEKNSQTKSS